MAAPTTPSWGDPDGAMKDAFRALRSGNFSGNQEKADLQKQLLSGTNAAWAWFALRYLGLSAGDTTTLCRIVARSCDGLLVLWTLSDVPSLSASDRQLLRQTLVVIGLTGIAQLALEQVSDLTDDQRHKLGRIAVGLPAEE